MFQAVCKLVKQIDKTNEIEKSLRELKNKSVLVGIPEEKATRPEDRTINNAELAYIHTNGSPIRGIPARPFIQPAIEKNSTPIGAQLGEAIKKTLTGGDSEPSLRKAGIIGQNVSRGWFTNPDNGWAPNTPRTIAKKGSDKPLIDTAEMRKSITFVVREK